MEFVVWSAVSLELYIDLSLPSSPLSLRSTIPPFYR